MILSISINNIDIDSIIKDLGTLISHDYKNEQKPLEYAKNHLNTYEFLKFFNIVDSDKAEYVFETDNNEKIRLLLNAIKSKNIDYISVNNKEMKTSIIPEGESEFYWYKNFIEDNILFLKFNTFASTIDGEQYPDFFEFQEELIEAINEKNYSKFVIDLRNNRGGSVKVLNTMVDMVKYRTDLKGEEIYIISGKRTNSASVALSWELQSKIGATVVGEETGGNVNLFSTNSARMELPSSKFTFFYSCKYLLKEDGYVGGVKPDIEIIQGYEDYINGIDTCYEYIKNININK